MKSVNKQFADMQKKTLESLEPMKNLNLAAATAFERIARKNYDLMGDLVDYAVAQVKTPVNSTNLQEAYEQSMAETKAFAEKVKDRTAEYVSLAGELSDMAKQQAPALPKTKSSSAKSASAVTDPIVEVESKATPALAKKKAPASSSETAKAKSSTARAAPASETAKATPVAKTASKAAPATTGKKAAAKKTTAKKSVAKKTAAKKPAAKKTTAKKTTAKKVARKTTAKAK